MEKFLDAKEFAGILVVNYKSEILPYHVISQIKGKDSENSYQELKRSQKGQAHTNTRKLNRDISTGTAVFLNRKFY